MPMASSTGAYSGTSPWRKVCLPRNDCIGSSKLVRLTFAPNGVHLQGQAVQAFCVLREGWVVGSPMKPGIAVAHATLAQPSFGYAVRPSSARVTLCSSVAVPTAAVGKGYRRGEFSPDAANVVPGRRSRTPQRDHWHDRTRERVCGL